MTAFYPTSTEEIGLAAVFALSMARNLQHKFRIWRGKRNRDPRRLFSSAQRRQIFLKAHGQCEYPRFMLGRCPEDATEADHIFPWSLGGKTDVDNGSALCKKHNLHKSNRIPSRRYKRALQRNRARQDRFKIENYALRAINARVD